MTSEEEPVDESGHLDVSPETLAFLRALFNNARPILDSIPDDIERIRKWEEENPEDLKRLEDMITTLSEEFGPQVSEDFQKRIDERFGKGEPE